MVPQLIAVRAKIQIHRVLEFVLFTIMLYCFSYILVMCLMCISLYGFLQKVYKRCCVIHLISSLILFIFLLSSLFKVHPCCSICIVSGVHPPHRTCPLSHSAGLTDPSGLASALFCSLFFCLFLNPAFALEVLTF